LFQRRPLARAHNHSRRRPSLTFGHPCLLVPEVRMARILRFRISDPGHWVARVARCRRFDTRSQRAVPGGGDPGREGAKATSIAPRCVLVVRGSRQIATRRLTPAPPNAVRGAGAAAAGSGERQRLPAGERSAVSAAQRRRNLEGRTRLSAVPVLYLYGVIGTDSADPAILFAQYSQRIDLVRWFESPPSAPICGLHGFSRIRQVLLTAC
jgi:hypothetical protein